MRVLIFHEGLEAARSDAEFLGLVKEYGTGKERLFEKQAPPVPMCVSDYPIANVQPSDLPH